MTDCPEYDRLAAYVEIVLGHLVNLTTHHLELFQSGEYASCGRVDKQLELIMGEKERAIGALRQHMHEHRCQGRRAPI